MQNFCITSNVKIKVSTDKLELYVKIKNKWFHIRMNEFEKKFITFVLNSFYNEN